MKWSNVSCNPLFYSGYPTIYTLRLKSHVNRVYNHKDKLNVAEMCFSLETYKLITIANCNEKSESKFTPSATEGEAQKISSKRISCL